MSETESMTKGREPLDLPRETLIATAVSFLANNDVKRHPINQKQQFLKSKGLSEQEIQIACERAGIFTRNTQPHIAAGQYHVKVRKPSKVRQLLEIINSIGAASGIAYCALLFYRRFIRPLLFGAPEYVPKKSLTESLQELETNMVRRMDELSAEVLRVREDVNRTSFQTIKSDLDAIKGLLLNKKQFASPIVPPSIPAWQLAAAGSSSQLAEVNHGQGEAHDKDVNDDNDTGSGSSETEIVTKNSDSSLEIM